MSNLKPIERAARYIDALRRIQNDRGKMAALRRGFSSATVMDAWPVVAGLGGEIGQPGKSVYVDVAALYGTHAKESNVGNFGESCRAIALKDSSNTQIPESYERRFLRLIASGDPGELVNQLRSWVRLAASKEVALNYESLFADLWNWNWYADDIRVRWARSFWASANDGESSLNSEHSTSTVTA